MDLLRSFKEFINDGSLFAPGDALLVAVSGGVDSVVLCELLHRAGHPIRIAHANFQLRGAESERDEGFVRELAARYGAPLHIRHFDTRLHAEQNKQSIQVAARELRYAWFHELLAAPASPRILVTAHHLDDNIETLLSNFFKGTGIAGLHGILPRQGVVVRPLLFARKDDIKRFAEKNTLAWVEDSSNQSDDYTRNAIRHQLIPVLDKLWPGVTDNLSANIERFRECEELYRQALDRQLGRLVERRGEELHVPVLKLKRATPLRTILFELIRPFGFSPRQTDEALRLLDSGSGRYILSPTHRLLRDRNWLIVSTLKNDQSAHIVIEAPSGIGVGVIGFPGGELELSISAAPATFSTHAPLSSTAPGITALHSTPAIACLDASLIQFPLLLRKWRQGDYFYPLGMRKKKKLARFFIDNKLSLAEKEKAWVLEMDRQILWIVGRRIDERFKVTDKTRSILRIESRMG